MKCQWCGGEKDPFNYAGGLRHCSMQCQDRATLYAMKCMDARLEGEEPPTKEEFKTQCQRSKRWTPETMHERVAELREMA